MAPQMATVARGDVLGCLILDLERSAIHGFLEGLCEVILAYPGHCGRVHDPHGGLLGGRTMELTALGTVVTVRLKSCFSWMALTMLMS